VNEKQRAISEPGPEAKSRPRLTLANDYFLQRSQSVHAISVCHIASGDGWGGAEAQIATLLKSLAERCDVRLCAILLNDLRLAQELRKSGVDVKIISESEKSFPRILMESAEYLRGRGVQVLHSHRYKENLLALLLALRYPVRLVRTQHGQPEPHTGFSGLKQGFVYAVDRQIAKYAADHVISVSSDLTGYLQGHVSPKKITIVRNGISLDRVRSSLSPSEAKQRLFIRADAPVIGIATRLTAIKRLDLFVATAACISKTLPNARFVIAGGGAEENRLRQLIQQVGMEHEILLPGHRADIYDVMRAMDILLLTSDHEGLPMVLLESMALGIPVVSRQVGGIPEVIEDGVTGCLVSSDSPVSLARVCVSLLRDPERRRRIADGARSEVEQNYSAEQNSADIAQIYKSLVPSR
jgi:glycosyltransferase involved in cell wall biosynthesis